MALQALAGGSLTHNVSGSTVPLYLSITDNTTGLGVTGQSPNVYIRFNGLGSSQDGFVFNGTAFVSSPSPIPIAMSQVSAALNPGLYVYTLIDPGLPALSTPITQAFYEIRYNNGGTPAGDAYEVRRFSLILRNVDLIGV